MILHAKSSIIYTLRRLRNNTHDCEFTMNNKLWLRQTGIAAVALIIHISLSTLLVLAGALAMNLFFGGRPSFNTAIFSIMSQNAFYVFDIAVTVISMGAAVMFMTRFLPHRSYYERPRTRSNGIYFALFFAALYVSLYVNHLSSLLFERLGANWPDLVLPQFTGPLSVILVAVRFVILPAFLEELLFRGALLRTLLPLGELEAAVGVSLIFAVFHGSADQWLGIMMISFVFSYTAIKTSSIIPSMLMHFINNLFAVAIPYLNSYGYASAVRVASTLLGVLGLGGALYYSFYRNKVAGKSLGRGCGVGRMLASPLLFIFAYGILQAVLGLA